MPTISQLPVASQVTAADQIPISQSGSVCSVSVGTLLAGTQPAILAPTGSLLGRISLGPGGPDVIDVGVGLALNTGSLAATGADHATYPVQGTLTPTDQAVISSSGLPKLLELSLLRGLFAAGPNIVIDQNGTITATVTVTPSSGPSGYSITALPTTGTISASDLVAISQAGTDHTITYANLMDGQTVMELQVAAPASDSDCVPVVQGTSGLLCQTMAAIWTWLNAKLPGYLAPTVELTANTSLTVAAHNGHMLICSQPVTISAAAANLRNGFSCNLINASSGDVSFGGGIVTSSGTATLAPTQAAVISCTTYSEGTLIYAWTTAPGSSSSPAAVPAQVAGLAVTATSSSSVALAWTEVTPTPTSYTVQYRITGTTAWSSARPVTTASCTVTGLLSATSYDFIVSAVNNTGVGSPSAIVTSLTAGGLSAPGSVTGLTTSNATANAISLSWSAPTTGGAVASYTAQYRVTGTTSWATCGSAPTTTTFTATSLSPATSYDFQVFAVNASGTGATSNIATASTTATGTSVTSITWNMVPAGSYTHGNGAIGVNAHVSPSSSAIQFGFSPSATVPPTSWTIGGYVNSDLWGAYVDTPATAGIWYVWAEGTDGSALTVYPTDFTVT